MIIAGSDSEQVLQGHLGICTQVQDKGKLPYSLVLEGKGQLARLPGPPVAEPRHVRAAVQGRCLPRLAHHLHLSPR